MSTCLEQKDEYRPFDIPRRRLGYFLNCTALNGRIVVNCLLKKNGEGSDQYLFWRIIPLFARRQSSRESNRILCYRATAFYPGTDLQYRCSVHRWGYERSQLLRLGLVTVEGARWQIHLSDAVSASECALWAACCTICCMPARCVSLLQGICGTWMSGV